MRGKTIFLTIRILVISALFVLPGRVDAASYSFSMDRFEVTGNVPDNQIDEFDDGNLSPWWMIHDPTVVESDGLVTFRNPGTIEEMLLGELYIKSEMTYMAWETSNPFLVENGAGNFTAVSTWVGIVPGENQFYTMHAGYTLEEQPPHEGIDLGFMVANWDTTMAHFFGIPAGLGILFYRSGPSEQWVFQHIAIDKKVITGDILLRLKFKDAKDQFKAAFSLDSGVSFRTFPDPIDWGMKTAGYYTWSFGAESWEVRPIPVSLDIKPQSCPNPLNVKSERVLPVAILGTYDFDVTQIDPASIRLVGVAPLRSSLKDVATPFEPLVGKEDAYACNDFGADEFMDLTLKFDTQEVVEALGKVEDGEVLVLTLIGVLLEEFGGTPIEGADVVVILEKGKE